MPISFDKLHQLTRKLEMDRKKLESLSKEKRAIRKEINRNPLIQREKTIQRAINCLRNQVSDQNVEIFSEVEYSIASKTDKIFGSRAVELFSLSDPLEQLEGDLLPSYRPYGLHFEVEWVEGEGLQMFLDTTENGEDWISHNPTHLETQVSKLLAWLKEHKAALTLARMANREN